LSYDVWWNLEKNEPLSNEVPDATESFSLIKVTNSEVSGPDLYNVCNKHKAFFTTCSALLFAGVPPCCTCNDLMKCQVNFGRLNLVFARMLTLFQFCISSSSMKYMPRYQKYNLEFYINFIQAVPKTLGSGNEPAITLLPLFSKRHADSREKRKSSLQTSSVA